MKAIINLDKVKYPDVVTAKNGSDVLENGAFVALGKLVEDRLGRDCYQIGQLAEGCKLGFVADVTLMYDETKDEGKRIIASLDGVIDNSDTSAPKRK